MLLGTQTMFNMFKSNKLTSVFIQAIKLFSLKWYSSSPHETMWIILAPQTSHNLYHHIIYSSLNLLWWLRIPKSNLGTFWGVSTECLVNTFLLLAVGCDIIWPVLVLHVVVWGGEAGLVWSVVVPQLVLQLLLPLALHQLVQVEGGLSVLHWTVTSLPNLGEKTQTGSVW